MGRWHLVMSKKEREYLGICGRIKEGWVNLREGSNQLCLSYRQMLRVYDRFIHDGDAGLVHRSRGRSSNRGKGIRGEVIDLYREKYLGFGPTLASEKFVESGYLVDHETVRRWLIGAGLWERERKRGPHRKWRERKKRFGELVQMDGSFHCWFKGDPKKYCLMVMVDDATEEEQLNGEEPLTAFGKSCQKLGIGIIKAYSPQAKGRVERKNGVYQDRLVKELNLKEIREIDAANCFLREGYEAGLNRKFAVPPVEEQDAHRLLPKGLDLKDIFCFEENRRVNNDWTIQYQSCFFQIRRENKVRPNAGQRVVVRRDLEGTLTLHYKGQKVFYDALEKRPQKLEPNTKLKSRTIHRPDTDHPWRKCFMATKELKEATV